MIRFDWLGFFFKMLFMFAADCDRPAFDGHEKVGQRGEAYLLLLASLLGMNLMAASADLVMLYLAIETTSIPLYILAGFMLADDAIHRSWLQVFAVRRDDFHHHALRL